MKLLLAGAACASLFPFIAATPAGAQAKAPAPVRQGLQLQLPACVKTGNCELDDIVRTGSYFANFLTALSAALFFGTFVYGGGSYLLSFGSEDRVKAGKKAMTQAAFGLVIVLSAWTLVNYLVFAITGQAT